jgi:hypothetical protein
MRRLFNPPDLPPTTRTTRARVDEPIVVIVIIDSIVAPMQ